MDEIHAISTALLCFGSIFILYRHPQVMQGHIPFMM